MTLWFRSLGCFALVVAMTALGVALAILGLVLGAGWLISR